MSTSVSIVMPCYNEEDAIPSVVPRALLSLHRLVDRGKISEFELIVVDDQSTDQSVSALKVFPQVKVVRTSGGNRGYGKALKRGFQEATGEWIGFLDMDNSYRPEDLPLFVDQIRHEDVDFIVGQRSFCDVGMSRVRGLGNWVYRSLAALIYDSHLKDVCSGYRFFHRRNLETILSIQENGLDFSIELTLKMLQQKTRLSAISIGYDERLGTSKLSVFNDGFSFFKVLLTSRMRAERAFKHS